MMRCDVGVGELRDESEEHRKQNWASTKPIKQTKRENMVSVINTAGQLLIDDALKQSTGFGYMHFIKEKFEENKNKRPLFFPPVKN